MPNLRVIVVSAIIASTTTVASGHEFWIDPERFVVQPDEPIVADLRVGEEFAGSSYAFLPSSFRLFEIAQGDARVTVDGRLGDRPALNQQVDEGLAVVLHVTTDSRLSYTEFEKFTSFVEHKDATWTIDAHTERGLSTDSFTEGYSRYAKSLVAVGEGVGADQRYGLLTELVALANPYGDLPDGRLPVQLFYEGAPRADSQIEVFDRAPDGDVAISTVRTDGQGIAEIPVAPGHVYMLDAVVLREPGAELAQSMNAVWESLWANLTFAVPDE